ncbi:hypothetical protein [Sciscionella sediminilitoris]|uniref:hypothetical protein n=1 Tax=Sciscionella sediminilitoris TaxID=1445613 RepID=UPI00068EEFFC|nr:hypothetical protein [Sciscionella sp. SE31]
MHKALAEADRAGIWLLRGSSALLLVFLILQGVTAGAVLGGSNTAITLHSLGAYFVHATALLAALSALWLWRRGHLLWPTVLGAVVLVLTFVQATLGDAEVMAAHVPVALLLVALTVTLLVHACQITTQRTRFR